MPQPRHVAPRVPIVIGLLGGIAAGKTEVARWLAGPTGVCIDADQHAHAVLESSELRAWIGARVGTDIVAGAQVDRTKLAAAVFGDAQLRRELEQRVHPRVRERIRAQLADARADARVERIVLDIPLLLESDAEQHWSAECDALVFVEADAKVRDSRAVERRGWTSGELARREAVQMPLRDKRARADFVVVNDGDLDHLRDATHELLAALTARRRPHLPPLS